MTEHPSETRGAPWLWWSGLILCAIGSGALLSMWPTVAGYAQEGTAPPRKRVPRTLAVEPATPEQIRATPPGELLLEGRRAYGQYCVGCHGADGDGRGPAAAFLFPKPRDFTKGIFKFSSRSSGGLPTDADLLRTLNHGLSGTSMREWELLPLYTKRALVAYIKTFAPERWADVEEEDPPIVIAEDPWAGGDEDDRAEAVARGEAVYHGMATCWSCHAAYMSPARIQTIREDAGLPPSTVRAGADRPAWQRDTWGNRVWPPEFGQDRVKYGTDVTTLYRVIGTGIGGTAMPAWKDVLDDDDIWAMAYYVKSLADQRDERIVFADANTAHEPDARGETR